MAISTRDQTTAHSNGATAPEISSAPSVSEHVLIVQTAYGLQRYPWTCENEVAQGRARDAFTRHRALGYRVYSTTVPGKPAEETTQFDPKKREYIAIMPMRGGAL